ncbi:MAG: tetratricopeptide repeat protein [Okeania sp. SIO2F4]|uniref:tetratricopeptide repeat protein n=1 Tax=Okeania sp. SIO2F4 TaxID=2607790 RepID=UPI0014295BF2|nr:tetratricopeptide repeat protein [Okeania sp. SIO2F4]NES05471.1 tetratricopeptide repeat protein [Okeania sp. SIO2F4]
MIDINAPTISRLNRQIYQRLKQALSLNLRRQVFIAVCDNQQLRNSIVENLQADLTNTINYTEQQENSNTHILFVTLNLNLSNPNPVTQINQWLAENPQFQKTEEYQILGFQIIGIENLTKQPSAVQWSFITNLKKIETSLSKLESSILLWITKPWLNTIKQSAPEFWNWHTGIFEFEGDPTPITPRQKKSSLPNKTNPLSFSPSITSSPSINTVRPLMALEQKSYTVESKNSQAYLLPPAPQKLPELPINHIQHQENIPQPELELVELANLVWAEISRKSGEEKTSLEKQQFQILKEIQELNKSQYPSQELAIAYKTLGDFHRDRVLAGEVSEQSLIIAIRAYEMVLEWTFEDTENMSQFSQSQIPILDIFNDLATLYWMLSRQIKSSKSDSLVYLERSIILYQMAMGEISSSQKDTYARLQKNLGLAYGDLATHQEAQQNWERSIIAYQEAIFYLDKIADTQDYATTLNNLGTAYWNLAQHTQEVEHLQGAISAYVEAIDYFTPEIEPLNYAMIQNNLGIAYWNLAQFQTQASETLILKAIDTYLIALKYRTSENFPLAYAATQNNLGTAYWHLANQFEEHQIRSKLFHEAIAAYSQALTIAQQFSPSQLTFDLLATYNNIGLAYYQIAIESDTILDKNSQIRNLEAALEHHLLAYSDRIQTNINEIQEEQASVNLNYILRIIRTFYSKYGIQGQNLALSKIPSNLLPKILVML